MAERRGDVVQRTDGTRDDTTEYAGDHARRPVSGPTRTWTGTATRRPLAVVVTCALALGLTGCTGTPAPDPSSPNGAGPTVTTGPTTAPPIPSPSTSPSPSPATVAAPERPMAMDRDDAEGAIAAATYFISLYPYVYASGDLTGWQAMSDPECVFCGSVSGNVTEMLTKGTRLGGGAVTWLALPEHIPHENGLSEVRLLAAQAATTEFNSSGDPIEESGASEADITVLLTLSQGQWLVRGVDLTVRV